MTARDVASCRVLVIEDEMLITVLIEDTLLRLGCEIVGPVAKLETALQLADERQFDVAILDVRKSWPRTVAPSVSPLATPIGHYPRLCVTVQG